MAQRVAWGAEGVVLEGGSGRPVGRRSSRSGTRSYRFGRCSGLVRGSNGLSGAAEECHFGSKSSLSLQIIFLSFGNGFREDAGALLAEVVIVHGLVVVSCEHL
jgi:hypothetical protein